MYKRIVTYILLVSLTMMFYVSCAEELSVGPENISSNDKVDPGMSAGELHNEYVKAFLRVRPKRCAARLDEDQAYLEAYIKSSKELCVALGIDANIDRDTFDQFLQLNNTLKNEGIWDTFNPTAYSPPEVINYLRDNGNITTKDAQLIQSMLKRLKETSPYDIQIDDSNRRTLLATAENDEASPLVVQVEDVLVNSLALWQDVLGESGNDLVSIDLNDPEVVAAWWKVLTKIVASALSDTIVFSITTGLTWNPPVVLFFSSFASLAVYEAFAERGW